MPSKLTSEERQLVNELYADATRFARRYDDETQAAAGEALIDAVLETRRVQADARREEALRRTMRLITNYAEREVTFRRRHRFTANLDRVPSDDIRRLDVELYDELRSLPTDLADVLRCRIIERRTINETARELGISVKQVRRRYEQGLKLLRGPNDV